MMKELNNILKKENNALYDKSIHNGIKLSIDTSFIQSLFANTQIISVSYTHLTLPTIA